MKDTIYREDAIKAIEADLDKIDAFDPSAGIMKACIQRAMWQIMGVPSANRPQGWIPCSEGLPKENTEVLISLEWGSVDIGWVRQGIWMSAYINDYEGDVLAWMPLPKPWKGANDDIH